MTKPIVSGKLILLMADTSNRPTLFAATFRVDDFCPDASDLLDGIRPDAITLNGSAEEAQITPSVPVIERICLLGSDTLDNFTTGSCLTEPQNTPSVSLLEQTLVLNVEVLNGNADEAKTTPSVSVMERTCLLDGDTLNDFIIDGCVTEFTQ